MLENIDNRAETEVNSTIQTDVSDNVLSISIIISLISKGLQFIQRNKL